jgi:multiple sugar transport system substrate-binding protein
MRRHRHCLLAALIALSLAPLAAQGSGKPQELTYWTPFTGGDGEYFEEMVEAFNASQGEVVMRTSSVKFSSYYAKLSEALAAGTAPDVFIVTRDRMLDYALRGDIRPLDSLAAKAGLDPRSFIGDSIATYSEGGKLYAIPWGSHPIVMYYNRALFVEAGIKEAPATMAQLVAAAKAIQAKTGAIGVAMDSTAGKYKCFTLARLFLSFLAQQGKSALEPSGAKAAVGNAESAKAYGILSDLVNEQGVAPKGLDYDLAVEYFRTGKAGIHFNGVWVTGLFESQADLDFGAVRLPAFFGRSAAWSSSDAFALPSRSAGGDSRALLAMRFIDWMTSHGELWAKAGHLPLRKNVYLKADFKKLKHVAEYAGAVRDTFETPSIPKWSQCYTAIANSLERSIALDEEPKAAMARLASEIDEALSK